MTNERLWAKSSLSILIRILHAKGFPVNPGTFDITLPRRQIFDIPDPRGLVLHCRRGCLWATVDGQPRDIVLEAGQSAAFSEGARVLVYALEDSCMGVRRAEAQATHAAVRRLPTAARATVLQPC